MQTPRDIYWKYKTDIISNKPLQRWEAYKGLLQLLIIAIQKAGKKPRPIPGFMNTCNKLRQIVGEIERLESKDDSIHLTTNALSEGYSFRGVWKKTRLEKHIQSYFKKYLCYPTLREFKDMLLVEFKDNEPNANTLSMIEEFIVDALPEVIEMLK